MQRLPRIRSRKAFLCFIPVLVLLLLGWFLFLVGFGWLNNHPGIIDNLSQALGELYKKTVLSHWLLAFGVPVFCIVYVVYVLTGHWVIEAFVLFLGGCCTAFGGAVIQDLGFGITIAKAIQHGFGVDVFINYDIVALCGAFIATIALVIVMVLIPIMNRHCSNSTGDAAVGYNSLRNPHHTTGTHFPPSSQNLSERPSYKSAAHS